LILLPKKLAPSVSLDKVSLRVQSLLPPVRPRQ
jgi:hypothetical protein